MDKYVSTTHYKRGDDVTAAETRVPINPDFWAMIDSATAKTVLAGALGGVVRTITLRQRRWPEGVLNMVVGACCALYLSPLVEPLLRRSQLPRVARLAVLIGFASVLLQGLATLTGLVGAADSWGAAFPLIVAAALVEKLHEEWELEGMGRALAAAARTVAVAVVALPVLLAPTVRLLAANSPIALALACTLLSWLVGTYRGLRLNELVRFRFVRDHAAVGGGS